MCVGVVGEVSRRRERWYSATKRNQYTFATTCRAATGVQHPRALIPRTFGASAWPRVHMRSVCCGVRCVEYSWFVHNAEVR